LEEARTRINKDQDEHPSKDTPHLSIRWLEGRSLSYGAVLSFWTITQLFLDDLGLSDGAPEARIKVALRRRVSELFGEASADVIPFLFHLLGVKQGKEEGEFILQLDGETLKRQVLTAITEYFGRVAEENPTVLVFEDSHWADPSTLEALSHLIAITDRVPLMIIMIMRIHRDHGSWQLKLKAETDFGHRFKEIHLRRLSSTESGQMVNHLLEIAELPESIRDLIMARSEGNPFYLEEIIRSLIDQGVVIHEDNTWRAVKEIAEVTIPETLQGVLLARIDRLEEDVRSTIQMASVIGKTFLYRLLEVISEAERHLDAHLSLLQRADLVREKARWPDLEYIFKHSLTQEAAYNSLLLERRKAFHLRVGEAIETLFPDRQEEFLGLLARHYEAAEAYDKAVNYLLRAGDKALRHA
jgi:predicted ATPase